MTELIAPAATLLAGALLRVVLGRLAHGAKGAVLVGVARLSAVVTRLGGVVLSQMAFGTACKALDVRGALIPRVLVAAAGRADPATGDGVPSS